MKTVSLNYEDIREDLRSMQDALSFIVEADESDAGGRSKVSGLAYAAVAKEGLVYCEHAIERLEKAAAQEGEKP